jgi:hypothetical protein
MMIKKMRMTMMMLLMMMLLMEMTRLITVTRLKLVYDIDFENAHRENGKQLIGTRSKRKRKSNGERANTRADPYKINRS